MSVERAINGKPFQPHILLVNIFFMISII
jgi:hypothetical protein